MTAMTSALSATSAVVRVILVVGILSAAVPALAQPAAAQEAPVAPSPQEDDGITTRSYQLQHAKAHEVAAVLQSLVHASPLARTSSSRTSSRSRTISRRVTPTSPIVGGSLRIVSLAATNTLLIQASAKDYKEVQHILDMVDVKRRQVHFESAIVEVAADSDLNRTLGALASGIDAKANGSEDEPDPAAAPGELDGMLRRSDLQALVQLLKKDRDSQVLAYPFAKANENVETRIELTETRFVTNTATVNSATTTSQQGEDAGIEFSIVPTISASGESIQLDLNLTISDFTRQAAAPNILPAKVRIRVNSSMTVADGKIVVIGGLSRLNRSGTNAVASDLYVLLRARVMK